MPIDFKNIVTTGGRSYDANMISRLNDSLLTMPIKQRASILSTAIEESGGDPLATSENGTYQGLLQWGKDRYRITSNDREKEFARQIQLIRNTINDSTDQKSWTFGGDESGYKTFKEPLHNFHNSNLPLEDIYRAFSYGYVRPKGKEDSYNNRVKVAQQVYDILKKQPTTISTATKKGTWSKITSVPVGETINGVIGKAAQGIDAALSYGQELLRKVPSGSKTNSWAEGGSLKGKSWNELSMAEKSAVIELAVQNGVINLDDIRSSFNKFSKGGSMDNPEEWTMEDEARFQEWRNSLPENLKNTDDSEYDMRRAFLSGMQPKLQSDGFYHLGSRDPKTGRILKSPHHPTFLQAIATDASMGYYPVTDNNGMTYTDTWKGNQYKEGGGIQIKPSHRGRLTELKKRTGKTEAELYNDGNPAHKKMVVFARNARKWKHGDGGNLFDGTSQPTQKMQMGLRVTNDWKPFTLGDVMANAARIEQQKQALERRVRNEYTLSNDATSVANGRTQNRHLERKAVEGAKSHAAWEKEHPILNTVGLGLSTVPFVAAAGPILAPAGEAFTGTTVAGISAPVWANTALEAGFGAHGLQDLANGNADWMTALEMAPLGSIVRPVYNAGRSGYSAARAFVNDAKANQGFAVSSPRIGKIFGKDAGQFTAWIPTDRPWSEGLSWINTGAPTTEGLPVQYITSKHSGEARKLYDAAIRKARKEGHPGIVTGRSLISAPKTYSTLEHYYPSRVKLDDMGHWSNDSMTGLFKGPRKTVYTLDDFLKTVSENPTERVHFLGAPRYRLETPSTFAGDGSLIDLTKRADFSNPDIRYDLPSNDIIIESNVSATPNIPFGEAWLAASKGRHQMSNLLDSDEYTARVRQAYQDNGIPVNQADFEILQAKQGIKDSDLKVVPNLKSENGEVLNGQYDPNTRQVLVSQDRDNILDVVESSGHENAHASEVDRLLGLLKEKWKHIKPRKEAFTRSDGSIDTEWKDYISKIVEMRAPAMSVWSEMKELGFSKVGDYLHHLKRFGIEDKQWEALVNRYGLTNAKYMVETVFGLSPFVINGISNEEKDSTTM